MTLMLVKQSQLKSWLLVDAASIIQPLTIGCPMRFASCGTRHRVGRVTEVAYSLMWPVAPHPVIPRADDILVVVLTTLMTRPRISVGLPTSFRLFHPECGGRKLLRIGPFIPNLHYVVSHKTEILISCEELKCQNSRGNGEYNKMRGIVFISKCYSED